MDKHPTIKEQDNLLNNLLDGLEAKVGLYRLETEGILKLLHASKDIMEMTHHSDEEYMEICKEDAIDFVYKSDREHVRKAIIQSVEEDTVVTENFRLLDKQDGYAWVSGIISRLGSDQGFPAVRIIFMPLSLQNELQIQVLESDYIGVYVIDMETTELYYANKAGLVMHGVTDTEVVGKTCHEVFYGEDDVCKHCWRLHEPTEDKIFHMKNGRDLCIEVQEKTWNDRRIGIVYSRDVTEEIAAIKELENTQAALLQSQEILQYACAFSGLYTGIYYIQTRTIYLDEMAQKAFGVVEKIENFPDSAAEHTKILPAYVEEYKQKFESLCQGLEELEYEFESYDANDCPHWVRMKCRRITSNKKEPIVVVSTQMIDLEKSMLARLSQERENLQSRDNELLYYGVSNLTKDRVMEYQYRFMDAPIFPENLNTKEHFTLCGSKISFLEDYDRVMKLHNRRWLIKQFEQGISQEEYDTQLTGPDGEILFANSKMSLLSDPLTGDVLLYEYIYDTSSEHILTNMLKMNMDYGYEMIGHWITKNDQLTFMKIDSEMGHSKLKRIRFSEYVKYNMKNNVLLDDRENYRRFYEPISQQEVGEIRDLLYRTKSLKGDIRYHKATISVYDKSKGIYLLTRRDYTDMIQEEADKNQRLSNALEEAKQANEAKNDFMARMSHDMRTPMNAILGMTHLAAQEHNGPRTTQYIKQIEESSRYLLGIINDVLEMGRIESGKMVLNYEWCTWKDILDPILHMIEPIVEEKKITLEYNKNALKHFPIEFYVDRQKSQQMLMNILNNACKFTQEGGTIGLKFRNLKLDRENCICTDQIMIEDTGCGMSEEFLTNIFHPFALERLPGMEGIPGTGLGLSISRSIAQHMGGDITVESQVNRGSVFTITYPYHYRFCSPQEEKQDKTENISIDESSIFVNKRILLVEDNKINAMIAVKILEKKGLQVLTASNGKEAVELFIQEPVGSFHLILMDIRMPVMDGLEATKQIRSLNHPDARIIPIIAMSANAYEEDRRLSMKAGMNEHLSKPVDPEKLYSTIQMYLREE